MAIIFNDKEETYKEFIKNMVENQLYIIEHDDVEAKKKNNICAMDYFLTEDSKMSIRVCPEPIKFLKNITKKDSSTERKKIFEEYISELDIIEEGRPYNNFWFNKTLNGINIRLGNCNDDRGNQEPAVLGDDCVHGVIVGRTGSGKSVLINNIILNLLSEYSPWELDLYLVDMKKVELSRYMADGKRQNKDKGRYMTPHVSACGATSEVRYVVSMIQYLCDCMKARQDLFAALGLQKISDFREKYTHEGIDFVLPRILLLVDEFQQMFLEASGREKRILDECITAITKLGRATGVHLLFASQEMSGALGSKELANFKLRIALPCDVAVSEQILGNTEAAKIDKKGITLVNKKGGSKAEDNISYQTPFIDDKADEGEESEFQKCLIEVYNVAIESNFYKVQKFYQEDTQENIRRISIIRSSPIIRKQIRQLLDRSMSLVDAVVLGTSVLYNSKENDYESFFIEKGKKRNIGVLCAKSIDVGNTLKTLVENFKYSDTVYNHNVIYEDEILRSVYPELIDDLNSTNKRVKEINFSEYFDSKERCIDRALNNIDYSNKIGNSFAEFICLYIDIIYKNNKSEIEQYISQNKKDFNKISFRDDVRDILSNINYTNTDRIVEDAICYLKERYKDLMLYVEKLKASNEINTTDKVKKEYLKNSSDIFTIGIMLRLIAKFDSSSKCSEDLLVNKYNIFKESLIKRRYVGAINIVWIIGTDNLDKSEDRRLSSIMEDCTNNKEIIILVGENPENIEMSYKCCNYIFLNSPNERLYTKFNINFTKKSDGNKTMDFKIINYNQERSYKQFSFESNINNAPELNFEQI